jgi:hypothetical protein
MAKLLGVSSDAFSVDGTVRLLGDVHEVTTDALGGDQLAPEELRDLGVTAPGAARALVVLHRKYRAAAEQASMLAGDGFPTPTRRFVTSSTTWTTT